MKLEINLQQDQDLKIVSRPNLIPEKIEEALAEIVEPPSENL